MPIRVVTVGCLPAMLWLCAVACGQTVPANAPVPGQLVAQTQFQPPRDINYFTTGVSLENVALATVKQWLARLGLEVPVSIDGRVSVDLRVRVPINALTDGRLYRVEGTVASGRIVIEGLELLNVTAELSYADSLLRLERLQADVPETPEDAGSGGTAVGTARLEVDPAGRLDAELEFRNVPLAPILAIFPDLAGDSQARLSGKATASVPAAAFRELAAWKGDVDLTAAQIEALGIQFGEAEAKAGLSEGTVTLREFRASAPVGDFAGSGALKLTGEQDFAIKAALSKLNLAEIPRMAEEGSLPLQIQGAATGSLDATGTLSPLRVTGGGQLAARGVRLGSLSIPVADVPFEMTGEKVELRDMRLEVGEGAISGSASLALAETAESSAALRWETLEFQAVASMLTEAGFLPPEAAVGGVTTGSIDFDAPAGGLDDPLTWSGQGTVQVDRLTAFDVDVDGLAVEIRLEKGTLNIPRLALSLYRGEVTGSALLFLDGAMPGQMRLSWKEISVGALLADATAIPVNDEGTIAGRITVDIPAGEMENWSNWRGEGEATLDRLELFERPIERAEIRFALADQVLKLSELALEMQAGNLTAAGELLVVEPYTFDVEAAVERFDLAFAGDIAEEAAELPVELAGMLSLDADFSGRLAPLSIEGTGAARGENIQVERLVIETVALNVAMDGEQLKITDLAARLLDGTAAGSGSWPLRSGAGPKIEFRCEAIDLNRLMASLAEEPPVSLFGKLSADIEAAAPAGESADPAAWTAAASFDVSDLRPSENDPAPGGVTGKATLSGGALHYEASGAFLGGPLEWNGDWPAAVQEVLEPQAPDAAELEPEKRGPQPGGDIDPKVLKASFQPPAGEVPGAAPPPADSPPAEGRLRWQNLDIDRLRALLPPETLPAAIGATANIDFRYQHGGPELIRDGQGEVILETLRWNGALLSERLAGRVDLSERTLLFSDFEGRYADGRAELLIAIPRASPGDLTLSISLVRSRLNEALAPWVDLGEAIQSRLDLRLTGRFGSTWSFSGRAELPDLDYDGTDAGSWRLPLQIAYGTRTGRTKISTSGAHGDLAHGRVTGPIELVIGRDLSLEGEVAFDQLDLPELLESFGISGDYGAGRVSGTLAFSGRDVEGLDDINAVLDAKLIDTQAGGVPVIGDLQRQLPAVFFSTTFREGDLRGRLNDGVFVLEELSLSSRSAELFATGRVSTEGRLNLEVTAGTTRLHEGQRLARLLLRRFLASSTPALALLLRINDFLSDRVVHLEITGTIGSPVIRVKAVPLLREQGLRFFLERAAGQFPL